MGKVASKSLFTLADTKKPSISLEERETNEIVVAFVGPVGSGVSKTSEMVSSILADTFKYEIEPIKVSDLIKSAANLVGITPDENASEKERVRTLQEAGTLLREKFGTNYLSEKCIDHIATHRVDHGGYTEIDGTLVAEPRRQAYLIDSVKHPSEIALLKDVYGGVLWVFGIFAPVDVRKARLNEKGVSASDIDIIFEVDEDEDVDHGQKVRDTIQLADFFIRNDGDNTENLKAAIDRYLRIIFGTEIITPTRDETAMYNAAAAAAGSACLSRQVGAAIYSVDGELIGKGRNDVPKAHGGLYTYEDGVGDNRCYKWHTKKCHNDDRKEKLYEKIFKSLTSFNLLKTKKNYKDVREALKATDVKNLIEYSRAVHAEMDAIISVARGSKTGIVGGTMYCTTFPCHSCARHIVASGISRTVYIEPYPKSLALTLHNDAISTKDREEDKVAFVQYEGVAPKNMLRLFEYRKDRKKDGMGVTNDPASASPISRSPLDGYYRREQIVVRNLHEAEGTAGEDLEGNSDG